MPEYRNPVTNRTNKCYQCTQNPDRPHICAEAQQFGDGAHCCGSDSKICFSFREVSDQVKSQWGDDSPELYLRAIFNSRDMTLD